MKRSKLIALLVIVSLSLLPLVPPPSAAQGGYSEKITAYVAGPNAAWFISIGSVNVTNPIIQSAEAVAGVSSYNLTAIKTISWSPDFQVFGPQGYNVLPVPFVPPEGAFLTVGADTFADASSAAAKFGSYLLTSFHSTVNGTGSFSFFAPLSVSAVLPFTLIKLIPFQDGGFLTPVNATGFLALASPMVTLSAQKTSGGGFVHQISIGSITSSGLDSTLKPNLLSYFGSAQSSIPASNKSTSSVIQFHFLDGLVLSSDPATITTNRDNYSSTYALTLKPGEKVKGINATVVEQPPELLATRVVDVGVLKQGSNMSVTITLTNLSNSSILTDLRVNDSWWQSVGGFRLVSGNSSITVGSLDAGQSTSPTYVLQYTGNATKQIQLPATPVAYNYVEGVISQSGHTNLNGMSISLGLDEPVVVAYVTPSSSFPTPVGGNQSLKVLLKNVGTRAASSVTVAGQQVGGLAADGGSASVSLTATAPSFTQVNVTKSYPVAYSTPSGQSLSLMTNSLPIVFAQSGMKVGLGMLLVNSTVSQLRTGTGYNLTLTMSFADNGPANLTSFKALTALPAGLPCGKMSANLTCGGGLLTLSYSQVDVGVKKLASAMFNVTQPASFIFWPSSYSFQTSGYQVSGYSNAQPAPTGLALSKVFNPSILFPGMVSQVTSLAANKGPFTVFNATLSTTSDGFDTLPGNALTIKSAPTLAQGSNITLSYSATIGNFKGSQSAVPATVSLFMGGTPFTVATLAPALTLNKAPTASITTSPTNPIEGSTFTVSITVTNPASVGVTGVRLVLPIPSGVSVSNLSNSCKCVSFQHGGLSFSVGGLGPGSSSSIEATVSASSGQTIPFKPATLSFVYANQTLSGTLPAGGIAIAENVTTRYLLPIGMAVLVMFVVAYEVRKMVRPTAPASPK